MSASNAFENDILEHIFQNANIANIGDATGLRGSSAAGVFYISLHTSDPGEGGGQNTNEADYTNYARVSVVRSAVGFTVTGDTLTNAGAVSFPQAGGGSNTITHFGIGTDSSGAGYLLMSGALNSSLAVSNGITPAFAIGALSATAA
jgi:hypothetical protein